MIEALESAVRALLRVPPAPEPPAGAAGSVRVFRAAPGYLYYRLLRWAGKQAGAVVGIVFAFLFILGDVPIPGGFGAGYEDLDWMLGLELLAVAGFLAQLPFSFLVAVLDFRYRWYLVTDRSLRIREGIWKVQERTMTFSNVQNLAIHQGPVQRLFGIADLEVRTAGGGESGKDKKQAADDMHVGYFRGVGDAEEIRDAILVHLRRLRGSAGLGDPDEREPEPVAPDAGDALAAARELLDETRALAAALGAPPG